MSKSLNQITKSVFKLSDIFYKLSLTKIAAAEIRQENVDESIRFLEKLTGKPLEELITERFKDISSHIEIAFCLIRQKCEQEGRHGAKYKKEYKTSDFINNCTMRLIKLKTAVDSIWMHPKSGGYKEYVDLVVKLNEYSNANEDINLIVEVVQPLINNIKFAVQGAIDVTRSGDSFLALLKAKKINVGTNAKLEKDFESLDSKLSTGDINVDIERDNEKSLLAGYGAEEGEEDEDWERVFENEVNFGLPDDFNQEIERVASNLYKALQTDEGGGKDGDNKAKSMPNIRTLLNVLGQKVGLQIDRAKKRLAETKDQIESLTTKGESEQNREKKSRIYKEILVQKNLESFYKTSLEYLEKKLETARFLDAYDDNTLESMPEEEATRILNTLKQKFNIEEQEHKKNLNSAANTRWRSESRARDLGSLTEDDHQWVLSEIENTELLNNLKECEKTFFNTRTNRQKYKGPITSEFKKEFPILISQIRNKKILKDILIEKIQKLEEQRKKIELLANHREGLEVKNNAYNHQIVQSIFKINEYLSADSLNEESIKTLFRLIEDVKRLQNEKPENIEISPKSKKLLSQIDTLITKENIEASDLQSVRENIRNNFPHFVQLFKELSKNLPSYQSEPFRQPLQQNFPRMMVNEPEKFKALMEEILNSEDAEILKKEIFVETYLKAKKATRSNVYKELIDPSTKETKQEEIKQFITKELKNNETLIAQDFTRELSQIVDIIYSKAEKIKGLGGAEAPRAIELIEKGKKFAKIVKLVQSISRKLNKSKYEDLLEDQSFEMQMNEFLQVEFDPTKYKVSFDRKQAIEKIYFQLFKPSEITKYESESSMMKIANKIEKALEGLDDQTLAEKKASVAASFNNPGGNFDIAKQAIAWDKSNMPSTIFETILNSFKMKLKSLIGTSDLRIFYR